MKRGHHSHCPIAFALDIFGDHWSLLILRDLIFKDKNRYKDFLESEEGISTNILADRLGRLEARGLISKQDDPTSKKQFLYSPTEKGLELIPVMLEIIRWSAKHDPKTAAPKEFIDRLKNDAKGLESEIKRQFSRKDPSRSRHRSQEANE
ncbi:MAG: winged helix-turn-helix transcriptional regulator [Bdellovibrionales bacterium]